jgi:hypothetical protein
MAKMGWLAISAPDLVISILSCRNRWHAVPEMAPIPSSKTFQLFLPAKIKDEDRILDLLPGQMTFSYQAFNVDERSCGCMPSFAVRFANPSPGLVSSLPKSTSFPQTRAAPSSLSRRGATGVSHKLPGKSWWLATTSWIPYLTSCIRPGEAGCV